MSIRVGDTIGDYRVIRELGAGGMGAVYEVKHLISDRTEAMKILLPDLEANPGLAERFLREIRLHASLSHPGIATLHTALRHDRQLLMVMEYVEGESLDKRLRRGHTDVSTALGVTVQLLAALAYAHSRSVIHRDIKPANIMLLPNAGVKLLDFGIARPLLDSNLTATGAAIGSLHYMSPEQLRALPTDHRTDLYSTGVTLYEMLTGVLPFSGDDPYVVMKSKLETLPQPAVSLNPAISTELSRIVDMALHRDADQRFQTAHEFLHRLQTCGGTMPYPPPAMGSSSERGHSSERGPAARTPSSPRPAFVVFEPESLERLTGILATFIGPVARLLVSRSAKKVTTWSELYQSLAAEVPGGPDRDKFLASCQSIILGRQ